MATENLKRYPRLVLDHEDLPADDYTMIPNSVIFSADLDLAEFRAWCMTRSAIPRAGG